MPPKYGPLFARRGATRADRERFVKLKHPLHARAETRPALVEGGGAIWVGAGKLPCRC